MTIGQECIQRCKNERNIVIAGDGIYDCVMIVIILWLLMILMWRAAKSVVRVMAVEGGANSCNLQHFVLSKASH